MTSELTYAWVIGLASAPLLQVAASAAQYPHIPPGADFQGYEPPAVDVESISEGYG